MPQEKEEPVGLPAAFMNKNGPKPATLCNIAEQVIFSRESEPGPGLMLAALTAEIHKLGVDYINHPRGEKRSPKKQIEFIGRLQFIATAAIRMIEEDKG